MLAGLSLGELKTTPPASTTGLVTEIGLVKADSRLEEKKFFFKELHFGFG